MQSGEHDSLIARPFATSFIQEIKTEYILLLTNAFPIIFANLLDFSIPLTSVFTLGHMGPEYLAASSLASMFAVVTAWSLVLGLISPMDTLCSAAFTANPNPFEVGNITQRAIAISTVILLPIFGVWFSSHSILLLVGINEELSALCSLYLRWLTLSIAPFIVFNCLTKFLQAQSIMHASTYVLLICFPINLTLNYFLVWNPYTSLGFIGAPITVSITYSLCALGMILYIKYINGSQCWGGFNKNCLTRWIPFIQLAIPGVIMICAEWWAFELMGLFASRFGTLPLASHAAASSLCNILYMIPLGAAIASSNRIGNLLGDGSARKARIASVASIFVALTTGSINSIGLVTFKRFWAHFFTNDHEVVNMIIQILPIIALFQMFDNTACVFAGILRGQGRQKLGASINITCFYGMAIPLGVFFSSYHDYGIAGLWMAFGLSVFCTSIVNVAIVYFTDWEKQVNNAILRVNH